jgi:integrase
LALRWRDVDFAGSAIWVRASYYAGHLTTPKSGKVRAVPWRPMSARRSRSLAAAKTGSATTIWCSRLRRAAISTGRHCVALRAWPACGPCAFTICVIPSARG